jgi:hypothetical protein
MANDGGSVLDPLEQRIQQQQKLDEAERKRNIAEGQAERQKNQEKLERASVENRPAERMLTSKEPADEIIARGRALAEEKRQAERQQREAIEKKFAQDLANKRSL